MCKMSAFQKETLEPPSLLKSQDLNYCHQTVNSDSAAIRSPISRQQQNPSIPNPEADRTHNALILQTSFSFPALDHAFDPLDSATQSIRSASISNISEDSLQERQGGLEPKRDSHVLYDINHNLKSSLTNLLHSQAIRGSDQMRAWVQTRLMEVERERKRQRRKRMSVTIDLLSPASV